MKNCIILGCGRSGTSMLAGTLSSSGYFMGDNLYPPRDSNPKGFFEDPFINSLNELIIANARFSFLQRIIRSCRGINLTNGQMWLELLPKNVEFRNSEVICNLVMEAVSQKPFCYKDPRFSYTLPIWKPYLTDTVYLCVFRDPSLTAQSIVRECSVSDYLHSVPMTYEYALETWYHIYQSIINFSRLENEWLFIHYDQVLTMHGLKRVESLTGAKLDSLFPDKSLNRTIKPSAVGLKYSKLYYELCNMAGYVPN